MQCSNSSTTWSARRPQSLQDYYSYHAFSCIKETCCMTLQINLVEVNTINTCVTLIKVTLQ